MFAIHTPRLVIRNFQSSDEKDVDGYASDAEVVRFVEWGPNDKKQTRQFVRSAIDSARERQRRIYELAIVDQQSARVIGGCGLHVHASTEFAMMGYVLHRDFWRRGLTSEAARALLQFGFEKLDLHRIYATCDVENTGSYGVMEKCAMRREGHFIQDFKVKGRWRDTYLYAILSSEWMERRSELAIVLEYKSQ